MAQRGGLGYKGDNLTAQIRSGHLLKIKIYMRTKNKSLDGLRGIACMNVVVAHFICAFLPEILHNNYPTIFLENTTSSDYFKILNSPPMTIFYNGHFAVLIFFILSGCVLTAPYFHGNELIAIQRRLWGRYFRLIIPITAAVLLSFAVYQLNGYSNIPAGEFSGSTTWLKTFYQPGISFTTVAGEIFYKVIFLGNATLIPPLWTLRIEFIGSVLLLICYLIKSQPEHIALSLLIILLLAIAYGPDSLYFIAIFLGSYLNRVRFNKKMNWLFFSIGLYFGAFQFENNFYNFLPNIEILEKTIFERKTFYNVLGALFLTSTVINGFGKQVLESRPAQFLARVSFSVYLLHFIILCSISSSLYIGLPSTALALFINFVVYILITLYFSNFFEKYVDRFAIKMANHFSRRVSNWVTPA